MEIRLKLSEPLTVFEIFDAFEICVSFFVREIWHVFILDGFPEFFLYFSKEFLYISAINASTAEKVL